MSSNPTPTSNGTNERNLSSLKHHREASLSRPSSRSSFRAHSPSYSLDDPVSIRTQMSTIKHDIRQKQAQLNSLETIIRTVPRPYSTELLLDNYTTPASMSTTPPPPSSFPVSKATKMQRRSSYDVLQGIAGPDSSLPLPKREGANLEDGSIPEGIPMSFGASTSPNHQRRPSSPTRSLSRIPVSAVGNARALAEEVNGSTPQRSLSYSKLSPVEVDTPSSLTLQPPSPSPNGRRTSLVNGGTTKVLADLQLGVINARTALENTKAQLRLSQRTVAQLTRQTEDLKEGRERLRLENEGLNNVVARKERLLQEVLERARKAEAEAALLKAQLKTETTTSKKAVREMEAALHESTALSQKSEREYLTLRDSIKGLVESFKMDADRLREEMRRREEQWRNEAESVGKKYRLLLEKIKDTEEDRLDVKKQHEEDRKLNQEVEQHWIEEIQRMKEEVERSNKESEETAKTAKSLAAELARLRRLMQSAGRSAVDDQNPPPP